MKMPAAVAITALVLALLVGVASAIGHRPAPVCPTKRPHAVQHSSWQATKRELAPKGAEAIGLCRYARQNAGGLVGSRLVYSQKTINELIREFDALKRFPRGAVSCPADDGSEVLAKLLYPHRHVTILVGLAGCNRVTNGELIRTAANFGGKNPEGPQLLTELKRLTRSEHGRGDGQSKAGCYSRRDQD